MMEQAILVQYHYLVAEIQEKNNEDRKCMIFAYYYVYFCIQIKECEESMVSLTQPHSTVCETPTLPRIMTLYDP